MIDTDLIKKMVLECIPENSEFADEDKQEAARLIEAAVIGICSEESTPQGVKELLTGFQNGYGCWLGVVENALLTALERLPPDYTDHIKGAIYGSFLMSQHFLFELEGHNKNK